MKDAQTLSDLAFEALRDTVVIAARRMTKDQITELADQLYTIQRRRGDLRSWPEARDNGTIGFT